MRYSEKELTADRRRWMQMDADKFVPQQTRKHYSNYLDILKGGLGIVDIPDDEYASIRSNNCF